MLFKTKVILTEYFFLSPWNKVSNLCTDFFLSHCSSDFLISPPFPRDVVAEIGFSMKSFKKINGKFKTFTVILFDENW